MPFNRQRNLGVLNEASNALYNLMRQSPTGSQEYVRGLEAMQNIALEIDQLDRPTQDTMSPEQGLRVTILAEIGRERERSRANHPARNDDLHTIEDWMYLRGQYEESIDHETSGGIGFVRMQLVKIAALCVSQIEAMGRTGRVAR